MGDKLIMSKKERQRKAILQQIEDEHISREDAAKRLSISGRQLKRIIAKYRQFGDASLIHKSRGCPSGRAYPADKKKRILELYEEKYNDFGPTLASEKLEEIDKFVVHAETLRLWLKAAGLWQPHCRRKQHRSHRTRRARFGALLQLDGSIHAWFGEADKKQCLMNMVDDATGKTLALMDYGETTRAAFSLLKWWIMDAGIPLAIYVDLKSLYVSPKSLREKSDDGEDLIEPEWLTHFSRACKRLGIEVIKAYSPQAKGRVERSHGVYQDRFVKELKLQGITDIEGANALLSGGFSNKLNEKFARPAASKEDAHVPLYDKDLDQILCWELKRQVKNDWTIRYKNRFYQIEKNKRIRVEAKQRILVREHLDGSITLWSQGKRLDFHEIKKPISRERKKTGHSSSERSEIARKNKHKSPWSQYNPEWLKRGQTFIEDVASRD